MTDLFDAGTTNYLKPLAERMRPEKLEHFFGQETILGPGKILRKAIETGRIFSMLFWGPPGTGKTTLARIIAGRCGCNFVPMSAVSAGVKEIKELAKRAAEDLKYSHTGTILFLDEVHRFNRSQQDSLLPYVEDGTLILIGATTENPSFEVNSALLSRLRVYALDALSPEAIKRVLGRALDDQSHGLGSRSFVSQEAVLELIASLSGGDARCALNILEMAGDLAENVPNPVIDENLVLEAAQKTYLTPAALQQAVAAYQACHFVGMPECALALAQVVVFVASAPKSNALESAYIAVKEEITQTGHLPVPLHLRNAPTRFMRQFGYGKGYRYAHDFEDAAVDQEHLPDGLRRTRFYSPTDRGFEKTIRERIEEHRRHIETIRGKKKTKKEQ